MLKPEFDLNVNDYWTIGSSTWAWVAACAAAHDRTFTPQPRLAIVDIVPNRLNHQYNSNLIKWAEHRKSFVSFVGEELCSSCSLDILSTYISSRLWGTWTCKIGTTSKRLKVDRLRTIVTINDNLKTNFSVEIGRNYSAHSEVDTRTSGLVVYNI